MAINNFAILDIAAIVFAIFVVAQIVKWIVRNKRDVTVAVVVVTAFMAFWYWTGGGPLW